jgi:hypothetical protein
MKLIFNTKRASRENKKYSATAEAKQTLNTREC